MLSVSEAYSQAIVSDSRDMPYRVTLAGVGVLDGSKVPNMTLEESVSGNSGIELGTSNSATLKLTIRDADPIDYNDMLVMPESGLVLPDGTIEWVPLGVFWVTDSSTSNDYKTLNLTCSDGMYNLSGEYVSKLTYPSTIKAVVAEIANQAGVEFVGIDSLPDIPVRKKLEKATHRAAIGYAAGCCGKNARFNREGKLEFVWYKDTGHTIERKSQYLDGMTKLNNCPLNVNFEIGGQQETYSVEVVSDGNGGANATPGVNIRENDTVVLSISPFQGYELSSITAFTSTGKNVSLHKTSDCGYTFVQPDENVTVTVSFSMGSAGPFKLTTRAYDGGTITQEASDNEWGGNYFDEGDKVTVTIRPDSGKQIDTIVTTPGDLEYTKSGNTYSFEMPRSDVSITVTFKDDEVTAYSWLQTPTFFSPSAKPYWAVFYAEDATVPTCQKFRMYKFDSWEVSDYSYGAYKLLIKGYYTIYSKNTGHGSHAWSTSSYGGNGSSNVELSTVYLDRMQADWDEYYGSDENHYCLIASNIDLTYNGSVVFKADADVIPPIGKQTGYLQNGMDIRERGSLTQWLCPDSFSTPMPSANWMVLMPDSGLYMTIGEDGKYDTPISSYPKSLIAFYYDSITIQKLGAIFSNTSEEVYLASFVNGRWTYLRDSVLGWDEELHEIPEGAVIGLRSPLVTTMSTDGYLDGSNYNFAGVLVTNKTLYDSNGDLFMYNNACRICACASYVVEENVSTFSMMRSSSAQSVTFSYTNPMIYDKMVPYITSAVQGITYTPAKIKHRGNPAFQAGDIVNAPDKDGVLHTVLIMQQRMVFGGGMNSEITCPGQSQKTKDFSTNISMNQQFTQAIEKSNEEVAHKIAVSNSLVYASIYKTISTSEAKIRNMANWQAETSAAMYLMEGTVKKNSASIEQLVSWKNETVTSLSRIEQKVDKNGASIGLLVEYDAAGQPKTSASLMIEAINGESSVKISADRVDIEGKVTADYVVSLACEFENGKVGGWKISGQFLESDGTDTGVFCGIYSGNYPTHISGVLNKPSLVTPGTYSNGRFYAGASSSGNIFSSKFAVLDDGSMYAEAVKITGTGRIGQWCISDGIIRSDQGVYGTYKYTTTGTDYKTVTAYAFTALSSKGVVYYLKAENDWSSTTLTVRRNLDGFTFDDSEPEIIVPMPL